MAAILDRDKGFVEGRPNACVTSTVYDLSFRMSARHQINTLKR